MTRTTKTVRTSLTKITKAVGEMYVVKTAGRAIGVLVRARGSSEPFRGYTKDAAGTWVKPTGFTYATKEDGAADFAAMDAEARAEDAHRAAFQD